ncbi:hypothetical protein H2203_007134 [Taxawa tesnikishii (nom. ined.)]|nr:hypothetical protein H2203_007134 [Dothideales sp. JES 119]
MALPHDNMEANLQDPNLADNAVVREPPYINFCESPMRHDPNQDESVNPLRPFTHCYECDQQYRDDKCQFQDHLMYGSVTSDTEAEELLHTYVSETRQHLEYIRSRLLQYGDTVIKRWERSKDKRIALLRKAMPDIYPRKFATQNIRFSSETPAHKKEGRSKIPVEERKHRTVWLLPYLDMETLSEDPMRLLALLQYRTEHDSEHWIPFDRMQLKMGWFNGYLEIDNNAQSVVMHDTRYGQLTKWTQHGAHSWDTIGYPLARLILEAQYTLMRFLRRITESLLVEDNASPSSLQWVKVVENGFNRHGSDRIWTACGKGAFSPPPVWNPSRLLVVAKLRKAAAEDEMFQRQTDPAYFQYVAYGMRDSMLIANFDQKMIFAYLSRDVMRIYDRVNIWHQITEECENVFDLYKRFRDHVHHGQRLPGSYEDALAAFELLLVNRLLFLSRHLEWLLLQKSRFKQNFERVASSVYIPNMENDLELGRLLTQVTHRPWPEKIRSQQIWERAQEIRKNLGAFWSYARKAKLNALVKAGYEEDLISAHRVMLSADQSAEYRQEQANERTRVEAHLASQEAKKTNRKKKTSDVYTSQTVWGQDEADNLALLKTKVKDKTRPQHLANEDTTADVAQGPDKQDGTPARPEIIPVSKSSLLLFKHVFPIDEDTFVAAMADAGYSAMQHSGSETRFDRVDGGGSVVFHRPHPETKINPIKLRAWGRTLTRRFGWTRDVSVERERVDD